MTVEDEVKDALLVVDYFKKKYKNITLVGHSEGALIGLLVAQKGGISKFVSLAGAGSSSATLIEEQIAKNAPQLKEESQKIINQLRKGELVENLSSYLAPVFRKSVQPYLISWFKYEPTQEINYQYLFLLFKAPMICKWKASKHNFSKKPNPRHNFFL